MMKLAKPKAIVVLSVGQDNGIGISWSDLNIESLCYLRDVFDMAVIDRLRASMQAQTPRAPQ